MDFDVYKLEITLPAGHEQQMLAALCDAGFGKEGAYDRVACRWAVCGSFRPLAGSDAFIGAVGEDCRADEVRLEMRVPADRLKQALKVVRDNHPYDHPITNVVPVIDEYEILPKREKKE